MAEYEEAGDRVFRDTASESTYRLHSLMIVKDDEVVYEKWAVGHSPEQLHILWSASKTFTALAVGFAEQEGLLTTDDRVVDFFVPNELPSHKNKWLEDITLHHLLTMSSGLGDDYSLRQIRNGLGDWARETLSMQHYFAPGEMYHYSSMDTYLLSVIVSKVTGRKLMDYLAEKLFEPLGIDDYYWEESPQGPPRKYYILTDEGRKHLKILDEAWDEMVEQIQAIRHGGKSTSAANSTEEIIEPEVVENSKA